MSRMRVIQTTQRMGNEIYHTFSEVSIVKSFCMFPIVTVKFLDSCLKENVCLDLDSTAETIVICFNALIVHENEH